MTQRTISAIAHEIVQLWAKPNYAAQPYLEAMLQIHGDGKTMYYADSGQNVVAYFLANAGSFRGEDAKRIKTELKKVAGI